MVFSSLICAFASARIQEPLEQIAGLKKRKGMVLPNEAVEMGRWPTPKASVESGPCNPIPFLKAFGCEMSQFWPLFHVSLP